MLKQAWDWVVDKTTIGLEHEDGFAPSDVHEMRAHPDLWPWETTPSFAAEAD